MAADLRGLDAMRRWARIFDSAFRIPGTEITFGIDPILGLFPGIGDLASPVFSLVLLWHGARLRVPNIHPCTSRHDGRTGGISPGALPRFPW